MHISKTGIYFRNFKEKKVRIYCLDPEYISSHLHIVPVGWFSQDSLFSPEQIACYIGSVEKKINGEEDEKI